MASDQRPREDDPARADLLHRILATLAAAYLPLVPQLATAKHCAVPLWACAKAGYWGSGLAVALLQRLGRDGGQLMRQANSQDHANVWWSLSQAPVEALEAADVEGLLSCSADSLLRMGAANLAPQACSNVLLACARLRHCPGPLLHHLTACLAAQPSAGCQDLANGLYALGELCEDCGHTPQPQDLQRLAAALAGRLPGGPRAMGSWRQQAGRAGGFIPQHLSNMLLGCAKLGYADPTLLRPLADVAGQAARRMEEQGLANSLYALGVLGCKDPAYAPAVECLAAAVQQRLQLQPDAFKPQGLSNILYALALLQPECGHQWSAVVELLAAECKRREFAGFSAQGLSSSAWALEKLGYRSDQGWFTAAVAAAARPDIMRTFTAQGLSNLWLALARVRHRPVAALLEGTIAASEVLRTQATGQHCANMLWSLATLGGPYDLRLVDVLVERLWELLPTRGELNGQGMANSLWALAVLGPGVLSQNHHIVERLLREVVGQWETAPEAIAGGDSSRAGPFGKEGLTQLWQVQQELAHADGCRELAGILAAAEGAAGSQQGSLLSAMRYAAEDQGQADSATSALQQRVVSALGRLQRRQQLLAGVSSIASVCGEQVVEGLVGRVDVVVELAGGRRVAVEVDGPWHFLANDPHTREQNGPTQLRDRQLKRQFGAGNVLGMASGQRPRKDDPARADLLHRILATLAVAYLPLVPQLATAKSCAMPLWACAKAGYWGGRLAVALLQQLGRDGGELMRQANSQDHANVWWSLSTAPAEALAAADVEELLSCSADSLLRMGVAGIAPQACSNVLLACARLRHCPGPLLHHLTACLAAQPSAGCQDLANGLYALGELC
ncbi:hypothetical protein TSOC_003855 [Tetrabaena socialis]|uniref:RAP domain-containing protein n=1 Tax=Tetrabaena socialis TaxID=47790 RepID=A0A2J8AAI0_9CHLO|nr:hypothetical protein TSOC_003855 [Tetrabaena socialis]|eukprot:PNH09528.1 hypothetical protein TSOC_003855 [Tetrabaena socialis]